MRWLSALARRLGDANIRTKLLLTMLSLLLLSVSSLFMLHLLSERQLLSQVREYTEELSTAIEIAQGQPAGVTAFCAYVKSGGTFAMFAPAGTTSGYVAHASGAANA